MTRGPREKRYTRGDLTLANAFTGLRLIMIPIFGHQWAVGDHEVALWVFTGAALTDLIDGFLARYLNQRSRLGALLDPIADKLLMFVSLVVGVYVGAIPVWLAACIIGRDALLLFGATAFALAWRDRHGPAAWRPTRIGKYAMFTQSATIVGAIFEDVVAPPGFLPWLQALMIVTAALTVIAGAQYVARAALSLTRTAAKEGG